MEEESWKNREAEEEKEQFQKELEVPFFFFFYGNTYKIHKAKKKKNYISHSSPLAEDIRKVLQKKRDKTVAQIRDFNGTYIWEIIRLEKKKKERK